MDHLGDDCDRCKRNCTCIWQVIYVRADCPLHRALVPAGRSFVPSTGARPDSGAVSIGADWASAAVPSTGVAAVGATPGSGSSTSASVSPIAPGSQQWQRQQELLQQPACPLSSYEYFAGGATGGVGANGGVGASAGANTVLNGPTFANLEPLNAAAYPQSAAPFPAYYQSSAVNASFLDAHGVTCTTLPPSGIQPTSDQQLFILEQQKIKEIEEGLRKLQHLCTRTGTSTSI